MIIGYDGANPKGPTNPVSTSTLAGILSPVTVVGGGSGRRTDTSLVVADEAAAGNQTYNVSSNQITLGSGSSPGAIVFFNQAAFFNPYPAHLTALTLLAGPQTNTIKA